MFCVLETIYGHLLKWKTKTCTFLISFG